MVKLIEMNRKVESLAWAASQTGGRVGLVPTMGALHEGHARLIRACRAESGVVIVSIFVNPKQFGPNEDLARYPRTLDHDLSVCEESGAHLVFAPEVAMMYPGGPEMSTFVEVPGLSDVLEGASRPGHFRGVTTVVLKLINIIKPNLAYFGQKDYQQQLIIRRMVDDLNLRTEVRTVETVREPDGLAMSSRNRYLDADQRRAATVLHRALERARAAVAKGQWSANRVRQLLTETIESEPLAALDYAEVADAETLERLNELTPGRPAVALLAVRIGTTRLIDNAILTY